MIENSISIDQTIKAIVNALGTYYIGDWIIELYSDRALVFEIHQRAKISLKNYIKNKLSVRDCDKVVVASLIFFSLEKYDGTFWPHFQQFYNEIFEEDYSSQYIENRVRELIKYTFKSEHEGERVITSLLEQTFVPLYYLKNLFDFMFDILKYNYNYNIFEDDNYENIAEVKEELLEIFNYLFEENGSVDDSYKLYVDKTYKSYKLINSTRNVLKTTENVDKLSSILIEMLVMMEGTYFNQESKEIKANTYLKHGHDEWYKNFKLTPIDRKVINRKLKERDLLKPKIISFDFRNKKLILRTRRHLESKCQQKDIFSIQVVANGQVIVNYQQELIIKEVLGAFRIEPINISIDIKFGEVEYQLLKNDEIIYKNSSIFSDVYFFDNSERIISNVENYEGNIFVVSHEKLLNKGFEVIGTNDYFIYLGHKSLNERLKFDNISYISREIKSGTVYGRHVDFITVSKTKGTQIPIFNKIKSLVFEISEIDPKHIYLSLNDYNYRPPADALHILIYDKITYLEIKVDTLFIDAGYYGVKLHNGRQGEIASTDFIYDPRAIINETTLPNGAFYQSFETSFFIKEYTQSFENLKNNPLYILSKEINLNDIPFKFEKQLCLQHYAINEKLFSPVKYIWLSDIQTNLIIYVEGIGSYSLSSLKKRNKNTIQLENTTSEIELSRAEIIEYLNKNRLEGLIITVFTRSRSFEYKIIRSNQLMNIDNNIFVKSSKFYLDLQYIGRNDVTVLLKSENITLFSKKINRQQLIELPIKYDVRYSIEISQGEDNVFSNIPKVLMLKTIYQHFSLEYLLTKELKVLSAYYGLIDSPEIEKSLDYR